MELPDDYLLGLTGAGLVAWLVSLTSSRTEAAGLAYLATFSDRELIRIGWYASPTRKELYGMDNAGGWRTRQISASYTNDKYLLASGMDLLTARITDARMARLDANLSAVVAPLVALQACIHASGTKLMVIETP